MHLLRLSCGWSLHPEAIWNLPLGQAEVVEQAFLFTAERKLGGDGSVCQSG